MSAVFELATVALSETDPQRKCAHVAALRIDDLEQHDGVARRVKVGCPPRPSLVHPRNLHQRRLGSTEGHAAFVHAICHIEFTAINLALDAALRFTQMPMAYYHDWLKVAQEEAEHFGLLQSHLQTLGYDYGDFVAHRGLWDVASRTNEDIVARLALVPRVMEARGLDVTPGMIQRLAAIDDVAGVKILEKILKDEIGHVAVGTRWFNYACAERGDDPVTTFVALIAKEFGQLRDNSINREARLAAGFTEKELDLLAAPR